MKALVTSENDKYSVEEVTLDPPKAGELTIKMSATGVCRSDLSVINGTIPLPKPMVLGHEGAGIVDGLGEGVTDFAVGDHVVLSFNPACGSCFFCEQQQPQFCNAGAPNGKMLDGTSRVHRQDGSDLGVMQFLGCMAEYAVVPAISAQKIDASIPLDKAALVGCGVMTGVGAAINTAKVTPGSTAAVFGCGGVGLSIIQGCRIAGARQIIAVDVADNKLEMAKHFGATDTVNASVDNGVLKCKELTGGFGPDFTFEAAGVAAAHGRCERGRAPGRNGHDRRRRQADRQRSVQRPPALDGWQDDQGELLRRHQLPLRLPDAPRHVPGRKAQPRRHGDGHLHHRRGAQGLRGHGSREAWSAWSTPAWRLAWPFRWR